ncbi:MAG: 2-amino-4-hydroxy-6-hydroxymethyldihydropteridine diphosphokinase [candidate division Zixibacteria bacterium]|nr:2-amino-4-hydroxy-6-hydroxymethyldihydropteridine diphosphokinase [candidate division Zixibacteria bacterium]
MAETIYLLLGSNLGDREQNLALAESKLNAVEGLELLAVSSIYESSAVDMTGEQPLFLNQVIKADYLYTPVELLDHTERIEQELGRTDKGRRAPRSIDLDILLFGQRTVKTDRLVVPHPELTRRPFALVPLIEIEPGIVHPVTGKPLSSYLSGESVRSVMLFKEYVARNL